MLTSYSKLISSKEIVVRIERHRVCHQWQFSLHPGTSPISPSHENIIVSLQRQKVRDIDILGHPCSPNVNASLNGKALNDTDRPVAPKPGDVHLVETLDQSPTRPERTLTIFVLRIAGVVDVDYGGGEGGVDAGDGDVALLFSR
jgi:hypothetical protein